MFSFTLSEEFLTWEEQQLFRDHLDILGLESNIWEVFASLFHSGTKGTRPVMLKAYEGPELVGAAILLKCRKYGRALINNRILSEIVDMASVPFYLWIKFGCCMDMMSNQGFVRDPEKYDEIVMAMLDYLQKENLLTIINDYSDNNGLYKNAISLPALPHAMIDCTSMDSMEDYLSNFKNIKRKLKTFSNKGGNYNNVFRSLDEEQVSSLKRCFISTADSSVFYLPYQDLYLSSAINTGRTEIDNVHYFIAELEGEFLGYQAAIKTGRHLNALHGAFDRSRKTTYHAYDILFVKMTEFALENGLEDIDFGAVLNFTKQKMVNKTLDMSYFILSKYAFVEKLMAKVLKTTKIQGKEQLKFRDGN